jgi:glucose-6-phosphate 1-dehydrogenase
LEKQNTLIVGAALPDIGEEAFRLWAYEGLCRSGARDATDLRQWCEDHLHYQTLRQGRSADYQALAKFIARLEMARNLPQNRIFYLALPPTIVPSTLELIDQAGLLKSHGWVRVVFEKPFGHDFHSARTLNTLLHRYLDESQIYRIDHYLGKETVQNLLAFRFANPIFESLWNRDSVESVEITVAEDLGVEHRGAYYQEAGALRDMVQNHLTQLLTVVGMEVPTSFEASEIQAEKLKVLRSISPIRTQNAVFGQYTAWEIAGQRIPGYLEERGVPPDSITETFVALKLDIHNWRWRGVPFYLRTGKRLPRKITQVAVTFRAAPIQVFRSLEPESLNPNKLLITLQPSEGFSLCFSVKTPGRPFKFTDRALSFDYGKAFGGELPEAYETLLRDIMIGDQTLFVTADFTETAWRLYDPLLAGPRSVHVYTAGSWGPKEADALIERDLQSWQLGW